MPLNHMDKKEQLQKKVRELQMCIRNHAIFKPFILLN